MGKVILINSSSQSLDDLTTEEQRELALYAGIGINPGKRNRSGKSVLGEKSMAKKKSKRRTAKKRRSTKKGRKRKASRKVSRKRGRKKSVRKVSRKRGRKKSSRKVGRKKSVRKVSRKRGRKRGRKKSVARNDWPAQPRRHGKASKKGWRKRKAGTSGYARPVKGSKRRKHFPVAANYEGRPIVHARGSRKGWGRRRRGLKGYSRPYQVGGRFPVARNPRSLMGGLKTGFQAFKTKAFLIDGGVIGLGSLLAPIAGGGMQKLASSFVKTLGTSRSGLVGKAFDVAGTIVVYVGSGFILKSNVHKKHLLYGGVAGLFSDVGRNFISRFVGGASPAAASASETTMEGVEDDIINELTVGDYLTEGEVVANGRRSRREF